MLLRRLFAMLGDRGDRRTGPRRNGRRLNLEAMESRALLSAVPWSVGDCPADDVFAPPPTETEVVAGEIAGETTDYGMLMANLFGGTPGGDGSWLGMEYFTDSSTSVDGHTATSTFDFSMIVYTLVNADPTAEAGLDLTINEGDPLMLDATGSTDPDGDPLTYSWDIDADGTFGDALGATPTLDAERLAELGIVDDGTYTLALQVDDGYGGSSEATTELTVENVAPEATLVGLPDDAVEGDAITLSAEVTDPGVADTHELAWSVTKDGEAVADVAVEGESLSFTPDDNGLYEVTVTATDDDGGIGTVVGQIDVDNVAPTPTLDTIPESAEEGSEVTLTGSATDPGTADTFELTWTASQDGQVVAEGGGDSFSFTPDDNGTFQVTLTATDDDGGAAATTTPVEVANVAPTLGDLDATDLVAEGEDVTLTGTVTDPGSADTVELSIDWGDDAVETVAIEPGAESFELTHAYATGGVYAIDVTAADDDGGQDEASAEGMVTGAGVHDGVLQVVGTNGDDHAFVGKLADGRLLVTGDVLPEAWQPRVYDADSIDGVDMHLLDGDDVGLVMNNVEVDAILRGGSGNDQLIGGRGNDLLLGGTGADVLVGSRGRDVMIGGADGDLMVGNMHDDLLIAGTTSHDANDEALGAILDEWTSDRTFDERVSNLQGTGQGERLNADFLLTTTADGQTVFDDAARDVLLGGLAQDWYMAGAQDQIIGLESDDRLDETV